MKLKNWNKWFNTVAAVIGLIAVIFGGVWAAFQYLAKIADDKTRASISYVERFNKPPLYDARRCINAIWCKHDTELINVLTTKKNINEYRKYVLHVIHKEKMESDILALIDFFDELEICIERNICDRQTAYSFFDSHIESTYVLNYSYIEYLRNRWNDPNIARKMESFSKKVRAYRKSLSIKNKEK